VTIVDRPDDNAKTSFGYTSDMKSRGIVSLFVAATIVGLAGCSSSRAAETSPTPVVAEPSVECLDVTAGAQAGIQSGLDGAQQGAVIKSIAATPATDASWFVAASFTTPGFEDAPVTGVWFTVRNPSVEETVPYQTADAFAASFSTFKPSGLDAGTPGVADAVSCVE
jgi:hypothetical protein